MWLLIGILYPVNLTKKNEISQKKSQVGFHGDKACTWGTKKYAGQIATGMKNKIKKI